MKKILSIFATISLLAILVLPAVSLAQPETLPESCTITNTIGVVGGQNCNAQATSDVGVCCMINTIYTVTNWIFYIMTLVAVLFVVFGGFTVLTSAGDPTKATKGKSMLTYAVIGLAIALLAKLVPSVVRFILGM